jgi:cytoskeletal protein CcmA (bactofilin family)
MKIKSYRAASLLATCGKVEVMKRGHVVAKMKVDELIVRGKVVGDVRARTKVTVRKTGKLHGDIRTPNLKVEFGAEVVGDCYIAPDAEEPGQSSE